ncbi:MAG: hypothetical protein SGARI_005269, partial [Bacillariaceae sp.]
MTSQRDKNLGVGAVVSFQSKFVHPHNLRDEHFPERKAGHRLVDAIVVRKEQKLINHKETECVVVHHGDFVDEDDSPQELWCAVNHIKVQREGDPKGFFAMDAESTRKESDGSDDVENQSGAKNHRGKRHSVDPNGYDDPLRPRQGRDLMWRNVKMTLGSTESSRRCRKKEEMPEKRILDNVWGDVPSKHVTAIMGPSGSGKTSLLNILAGRASSHGNLKVDADIRLNNYS